VPAFIYRQLGHDVWLLLRHAAAGDTDRSFVHETRVLYSLGYVFSRFRAESRGLRAASREIQHLLRVLWKRLRRSEGVPAQQ
jgi:hypothetical protein